MKSSNDAEEWFEYLRKSKARNDYIASIIKDVRKKHPGLSYFEIVSKYSDIIDKKYPKPVIKDTYD